MLPEKKQVLITVKAYPNPSKKYTETVCCAGIDLSNNSWIRLYPIPFRYLKFEKQFKKYSIIEIICQKAKDDKRPESYKVDSDSIKIIDWLDTKNKWAKRNKIILPTLSSSLCEILNASEEHDKSLGAFRPTEIEFSYKKASIKDTKNHEDILAQRNLFENPRGLIEQIPYDFYYSFKCQGKEDCQGHNLPIIDWEIGEAFRDWKRIYPDEKVLLEKIKERWLLRMCSEKNDVSFFVGNQIRFRKNFMILGTYYPPKSIV